MKRVVILKNSVLFSSLGAAELHSLAAASEWVAARTGEVILWQGERSHELYVVAAGRARAVAMDDQGGRITLEIFKKGDHFGETSFINNQTRSATVEALTPLQLVRVPRPAFEWLVRRNPDLSFILMRGLSRRLRRVTRELEDLAFIVGRERLQDAHLDTVQRLALAAECKDDHTGAHLERVSRYSETLARGLGMAEAEIADIGHAAPMHDIGKIGIPERILLKPERLTAEERRIMRTHPLIGGRILANPVPELLKRAREIALGHHERFDGKGYPLGSRGEGIPLSARIVAVADVFDALTTLRPYKSAFPPEKAAEMIHRERGHHFDPDLVDIFEEKLEMILNLRETLLEEDERTVMAF